jgi:hypothetical protein
MPSACLTIWTPLILSHLSLCPVSPVETQISATLGPMRVVPKMYREQIVKLCHDPPLAGHQGIERTIEKVKSRYYWRGISKDVSAYVKGCMECNQNKNLSPST